MHILNTVTTGSLLTYIIWSALTSSIVWILSTVLIDDMKKEFWRVVFSLLAVFYMCSFLAINFWGAVTKSYVQTTIYATFDNTAAFTDIYENYEIVSERAGVYELKEK